MDDDIETYSEIIRNNPFWEIYEAQFEVLAPVEPPALPDIPYPNGSLPDSAYYSYISLLIIAILWFVINKSIKKRRQLSCPRIYFNNEHQWYYYQFNDEEPSLITGSEPWLPKQYHFDIDQEDFYYEDPSNSQRKTASIEDIYKAASGKTPVFLFPAIFILAGYFVTQYLVSVSDNVALENYNTLIAQQELQISQFNPFNGLCVLASKSSLIPQQMSVQILYDQSGESNVPIALEQYFYLEGDSLSTPNGEIYLPTQFFLHSSPELIADSTAQNINFRDKSSGNNNCTQGNTILINSDSGADNPEAYLVPVDELKTLSLGDDSGTYESKLFGRYDSYFLINASSYEVRSKQYSYSIDNLPGCNSVNTGVSFAPGFMGLGDGFIGKIVPWDTPPEETLDAPDFQRCSIVSHLEFR